MSKRIYQKKIYFLENDIYLENDKILQFEAYNEEIDHLNEEKIELFINEQNKTKNFQKYFIPEKEEKYEIKLYLKIK